MTEQKNDQPSAQDCLGLGAALTEALGQRPLTAREVVQWLARRLEQAPNLQQLQTTAEQATGVIHTLHLCWLVSEAGYDTMRDELNVVYFLRQRELSGANIH